MNNVSSEMLGMFHRFSYETTKFSSISELTCHKEIKQLHDYFLPQVRALHKQLKIAEKAKEVGQEELKLVNQSLAQVKDELQVYRVQAYLFCILGPTYLQQIIHALTMLLSGENMVSSYVCKYLFGTSRIL